MNLLYHLIKIIIDSIILLIASSINGIFKAIEIIKPENLNEWIILIIAIPVPFGVTALWFYKYMKIKNS